jgi:hypothetical protein
MENAMYPDDTGPEKEKALPVHIAPGWCFRIANVRSSDTLNDKWCSKANLISGAPPHELPGRGMAYT